MAASHFFVGLSAGIAILAVPVLMLTPGSSVPGRVIDWIEGPPPAPPSSGVQVTADAAANRPLRGYRPGDPTPAPEAVPTVAPYAAPTRVPTPPPAVVPGSVQRAQPAPITSAPPLASLRWAGTGVIRSGGAPVSVRRVPGVDSADDAQLPDGSPVLVSTSAPLQVGAQQFRAVRALSGVVGWVPLAEVAVDGEAPPPAPVLVPAAPSAGPTTAASPNRAVIANTDGTGVVLRNSPNDADRSRSGLLEGASVTVLEASGADWLHVRADSGQTGWVPARYVVGAG